MSSLIKPSFEQQNSFPIEPLISSLEECFSWGCRTIKLETANESKRFISRVFFNTVALIKGTTACLLLATPKILILAYRRFYQIKPGLSYAAVTSSLMTTQAKVEELKTELTKKDNEQKSTLAQLQATFEQEKASLLQEKELNLESLKVTLLETDITEYTHRWLDADLPEDPNSKELCLRASKMLHGALLENPITVPEKEKLLEDLSLILHPNRGGTKEAFDWIQSFKKNYKNDDARTDSWIAQG